MKYKTWHQYFLMFFRCLPEANNSNTHKLLSSLCMRYLNIFGPIEKLAWIIPDGLVSDKNACFQPPAVYHLEDRFVLFCFFGVVVGRSAI